MIMMIFLQLQSKASLHLDLLKHASTFNPNGSSSSTEDKNDKTKQRKLQKVRVQINKIEFNNHNFDFLHSAKKCNFLGFRGEDIRIVDGWEGDSRCLL